MTPADSRLALTPPRQVRWLALVGALISLATILRIVGILDDFWLDEIWSWRIARALHSPIEILTAPAARVDNNHPLNTLLLYVLGNQPYWPLYRIPSLLAGIATILLATWHASRTDRVQAACTALLFGLSYPLTLYSSEARGYAPMLLYATLSFIALDRYLRTRSWSAAILFSASATLGFLSHLTFAHFYLAAMVWSAVRLVRGSHPRATAAVDFLHCHLLPAAFAIYLYATFASHMTIGGAPDTSLWPVVVTALSLTGGGPSVGPATPLAATLTAATILGSLLLTWFTSRPSFSFFLTCTLISPTIFVAIQALSMRGSETLFPRYFLVSTLFAYLLIAQSLSSLWRNQWRAGVIAVLACFAAASLYQTTQFLHGTRGHYLEAVNYMASTTPTATVSADNDFRTQMLLDFYRRYLPQGQSISYVTPSASTRPDWFIINTPQSGFTPPTQISVATLRYRFDREFTYHGLSGWSWYLYRRAA